MKKTLVCCLLFLFFSLQYILTNDTIATIVLGVLTILIFFFSKGNKSKNYFDKYPLHVFIFAAYCCSSIIWAENVPLAIDRSLSLVKIFFMILLLYVSIVHFLTIKQILLIIMWGGFVVVLYTFLTVGVNNLVFLAATGARLNSAEFINVNVLGLLAANVIIINIFFKIYDRFNWDVLIVIPCLMLIIVCGSRKSVLVLLVSILLLIAFKQLQKNKLSFILKFAVIVTVFLFLIMELSTFTAFSLITERMQGLIALVSDSGEVDHSVMIRQEMQKLGFNIFSHHPIAGIGIDNARIYCERELGVLAYLHNNYAELAADLGAIGLLLYYRMYYYVGKSVYKYKDKLNSYYVLVITLLISMVVSDMGVVTYYYKENYFLMMVLYICISQCCNKSLKVIEK